ncbi:MAG: Helicase associated domain protein [Bacteroidia bacterium]|nr:Helicase associated domain protein [Bacteroidia bacterium]
MTIASKKILNLKPTYNWDDISALLKKELEEDTLLTLFKSLYEGNGWIVSTSRIKGEIHSDLLLSYPTSPAQTALIINIVHQPMQLTFTEVKTLLKRFELQKSEAYHCQQFAIVAPGGFDAKCEKLKKFNLLLQDEGHIKSIIRKYSNQKRKQPEIQLFAHNQNTYEKVTALFKPKNRVAIVQATGTGKSYLIAKILSENKDKAPLVMAPSHYILEQIKGHIRWEGDNIKYMTYASSMYLTDDKIKALKTGIIILDEFHRCGAEEWGNGVLEILNAYPKAKVLGCSATPVRYLDGARDMSIELFHGNVAENLSLSQAIVKKILPMPKYVSALYSLQEEVEKLGKQIENGNKTTLEKTTLFNKLEVASVNWDRTKGVAKILQKYILPGMTKFIIFCREGEHIYEMEQTATAWFKQAFPKSKILTYRVISAEPDRNINLKNFIRSDDPNTYHLLFSIDMLNEGLHIDNVSGVILLRPTQSPTIFYQQIGRCLKVGFKGQPLIFDFVNNFQSIRTHDFLSELELFRKTEKDARNDLGLEEICPPFTLIDEVKEITEVFGQIRFFSDTWEVMFQRLVEYKKRLGNCMVPYGFKEDKTLAIWVTNQRSNCFIMPIERKAKLDMLGFIWNADDEKWNLAYSQLCEYVNLHGHCNVKPAENKNLSSWCNTQRSAINKGQLPLKRKRLLEKIEFDWDPMESQWVKKFKSYKTFLNNKFTEVDLNKTQNKQLKSWVHIQRVYKRKNKLSLEKIDKLNAIEINWNPNIDKWELMYQKLLEFKASFDHCRVPSGSKVHVVLSRWCAKQRTKRNEKNLSELKIKKLDDAGFEWEILTTQWFVMYNKLVQFYENFGHCKVTDKTSYPDLFKWCAAHRTTKVINRLPKERKSLLDNIGFIWKTNIDDANWNEKFEILKKFKEVNGHLNISEKWLKEFKLKAWYLGLRLKSKPISENRVQKLLSIGFDFDPSESQWLKRYEELKEYKRIHKHTNVPLVGVTFQLAQWVLRHRNYPNLIKADKKKLLGEIGFEWRHHLVQKWYINYYNLIAFKEKYGNFNVPSNAEYKTLSKWLLKNIRLFQQGKLNPEFAQKLKEIDLTTLTKRKGRYLDNPEFRNEKLWEESFNLLVQFKKEYGHINVPKNYVKLSNWTNKQRRYYREKKLLSKDKIKRLADLGFVFVVK